MPSYKEVLRNSQQELKEVGVYEQSAQLLMLELANQSAADLYMCYEEEMPSDLLARYMEAFARLKQQEPLQYILGYQWFYGRQFIVDENVLIPRYETEELVANVLADIDEYFPEGTVSMADVGTGSGAIAISLALEEPRVSMVASDISEEALGVARKNNANLEANVEFFQGDLLEPLIERGVKLDFLVSNPPYIPDSQVLEVSVKDFEPNVALFGGVDGLYCYRRIFDRAHSVMKDRCILAFEIGYDQKEALEALAKEAFVGDKVEVLKDINGKDRMLFIYHNV
ncbi:MAG: peptide chain release factor N(5)-glutamine methyltransferase [Erysipelotrichaceae bacterium]|nr:peptide chain release factor N(5)-glutamine methyltransferase [Erysipelotrichaceae bacterium]